MLARVFLHGGVPSLGRIIRDLMDLVADETSLQGGGGVWSFSWGSFASILGSPRLVLEAVVGLVGFPVFSVHFGWVNGF